MRIELPTETERDAVRSALLRVADDLWITDRPLARALFVTRAGLVARELVDELVRSDRLRHDLTYADIGCRVRHHGPVRAPPLRASCLAPHLSRPSSTQSRSTQTCRFRFA